MFLDRVRTALEDKGRALTLVDGTRLLAESSAALPSDPGLALLLAIDGAHRAPGLLAINALLAAVRELHEGRTLVGHNGVVRCASFSPDGKCVVTGSRDGTARIWDAETGKEILTLKGHDDQVVSASFSPDGKWVLTASYDSTARLWPVDILAAAERVAPRKLTPEERERFALDGPTR